MVMLCYANYVIQHYLNAGALTAVTAPTPTVAAICPAMIMICYADSKDAMIILCKSMLMLPCANAMLF